MSKTEHYQFQKPDEQKTVEQEIRNLQTVLDVLDAILFAIRRDVDSKSPADHGHGMAEIEGLVTALSEKMPSNKEFSLADLTDVLGSAEAALGYILVKTAQGWQAQSALSAIGEHKHKIQDILTLDVTLAEFITKTAAFNAFATKSEGELARSAVQPAAIEDFVKSVALLAALAQKLDKNAQAADSAKLNNKTEAGLVASGPIADAIAAAGNWPGVYTGTNSGEVNFPIGHTVHVNIGTAEVTRNATATVYRANNSGTSEYSLSTNFPGGVAALTGTYRSRGGKGGSSDYTKSLPYERVV